jgi:hypothetical protein
MGCSNLGGGGCWRSAEGHGSEDGGSGTVVGDASRQAAVIWRAKTSGRHTALGLDGHIGRLLSRHTLTADFAELLSSGHGALGERLASTASRGRRVARH